MSMTPQRRFFGLEAAKPGDRELLELPPEGVLKSGQIEAALERRLDTIARHPLGGSAEARHLQSQLERAADRLQAEIALTSKGPLHPAAARRAAARARVDVAAPSQTRAQVVAPRAITEQGAGLSVDDLTDFDRLALGVLAASGGWNSESAMRLAAIAEQHGVSQEEVERVVEGIMRFLSNGAGVRDSIGEEATMLSSRLARAQIGAVGGAAEGAVERVLTRINDAIRDEVGGGSRASRVRLTVIFALFALSWMAALGYLFFGDSSGAPKLGDDLLATSAGDQGGKKPDAAAPAPRGDVDANGKSVAPIDALAAPAKFPKPPGFVPSRTPAFVRESASAGAAWLSELEEATRTLAAAKGRLDGGTDANRAEQLVTGALSRAADAWPAAGGYRSDLLLAFGGFARTAQGADSLRKVMELVPGDPAEPTRTDGSLWQREWRIAFGAGCLASVAVDPAQPPEVAAAAREEMRQRGIPIPRGPVPDAFGAAAVAHLSSAIARMSEQLVFGSCSLDDIARWTEAVTAASSTPRLKIEALIAAIDAVLHAPGALDKPGPIVDALAFFIRSLDFTGRGADSELVRGALAGWIVDANIPPTRIWVFTSLLDADLGIAWYGPDLVLATNGDASTRTALAAQVDRAFPRVATTAIGQAILVDASPLEAFKEALARLNALPATNHIERLRNGAAALALARTERGFARGDEKIAKAGLSAMDELATREAKEWLAPIGGNRPGIPASGVTDGSFVAEWTARRDQASRLDAVRALRSRPAAGDLGPQDARLAAVEALRGTQAELRGELARVLVDKYANGPEVLRAVLDALADINAGGDDARLFVGALSGATVAGKDWVAEARRGLLEKLYALDDSVENATDATCAEIASTATALAAVYGKSESTAVLASRPDRSLAAACDAMRAEAETRFLSVPFPASVSEIERQRVARRSLALGLTQRMAAESASMLEYAAMIVVSRQPALQSKVSEMLAEARRVRAGADSASAQVASDLQAMVTVLAEGLAPKATERSGA